MVGLMAMVGKAKGDLPKGQADGGLTWFHYWQASRVLQGRAVMGHSGAPHDQDISPILVAQPFAGGDHRAKAFARIGKVRHAKAKGAVCGQSVQHAHRTKRPQVARD
jgi:hypothetical protein